MFTIPYRAKIGLYGIATVATFYLYNEYNLWENKLSFDFALLDEKTKKFDALYEKKGNRSVFLYRGEHISSKNGMGDSLRNSDKSARLKITDKGYLTLKDVLVYNNIENSNPENGAVLLLNEDGKLRIWKITGYTIFKTTEWKNVATLNYIPIDKLELTDNGDLIGYNGEYICWKNFADQEIPAYSCNNEEIPPTNPPIITINNPIEKSPDNTLRDDLIDGTKDTFEGAIEEIIFEPVEDVINVFKPKNPIKF